MSKEDKFTGSVRVAKFKVMRLPDETYRELNRLSGEVQEIVNQIWRRWLTWHTCNGSDRILLDYMATRKAWHDKREAVGKAKAGPSPKCDLFCFPKKAKQEITRAVRTAFPKVHSRVFDLILQDEDRTMSSSPAANSAYPRWMRVLTDHGQFPNSIKPHPIPFDRQSSPHDQPLLPPLEKDDNWKLRVRLDRYEKANGKGAASTLYEFELHTKSRKCASQTAILNKILCGEAKFCGSKLVKDSRTGTWYVHIAWRAMKEPAADVDVGRVAYFAPGAKRPWLLRSDGFTLWIGGRGAPVRYARRRYLTSRWSYQEGYRYASSARKGHGRKRAIKRLEELQKGWRDFVKTANYQAVAAVLKRLQDKRCGTLIYFQPAGPHRDTRFLFREGKVPGRRDSTGWDWAQIAHMLSYKCERLGIKFEVRQIGKTSTRKGKVAA